MKIQFTDLTGTIVSGDLLNKVSEIVNAATTDSSLSGEQLWNSLVYSGVSLGADEVQRYFIGQTNSMVHLLRELINRLEVAQAMTDDEIAVWSFQAISAYIHEALRGRAAALVSMHAKEASEMYGIDPELITGDLEPEQHPRNMLISAGHTAYRKMPGYFMAWSTGTRSGELAKLKCHCSQCIAACLPDNPVFENDELDMAMTHFGGLDGTFAAFGVFLITECREALYREISGLGDAHNAMSEHSSNPENLGSAEDLTKGFMRHLMNPKFSTGGGQPQSPPPDFPPKNG